MHLWNISRAQGAAVSYTHLEDKYEMKYVPEDFDRYDQGFFGRAKPEYIIVKGECLEKLKQQGYEMDCWQKGIPLAINNKHPDSIKLKGF